MDKIFNNIKNFFINILKRIPKLFYLYLLLMLSIVILIIILCEFYTTYNCINNSLKYISEIQEKNKDVSFDLNKIILFSSAFSNSTLNSNSTLILDNLYQYTDIALYINNNVKEFNNSNTLKKLRIDNIQFENPGNIGEKSLYFLPLQDFATERYNKSNIISNNYSFNISSENNIDFTTNTLYNNCANPITLKYINNKIKENYGTNATSLKFDGSILKSCGVLLSAIQTKLSFDIYITNNSDEEFKYSFSQDIPLENSSSTVYDGSFIFKDETSHPFYRYK